MIDKELINMTKVKLKKHREALVDLERHLIKHTIKVNISRREANSWKIIKKRMVWATTSLLMTMRLLNSMISRSAL